MEKRVQDYTSEILEVVKSNASPAVLCQRLQDYHEYDIDDILEKLLYQGVTRARDKLCIIVLDNKEVFEKLLEIKSGINREYID